MNNIYMLKKKVFIMIINLFNTFIELKLNQSKINFNIYQLKIWQWVKSHLIDRKNCVTCICVSKKCIYLNNSVVCMILLHFNHALCLWFHLSIHELPTNLLAFLKLISYYRNAHKISLLINRNMILLNWWYCQMEISMQV